MAIKVASYNIHFGVGQDGRYDLERIANVVSDQDIICLQEVTRHWSVSEYEDQPERLSSLLNMYSTYVTGFDIDRSHKSSDGRIHNARSQFGNMVLSKWPILYSRGHSLPRPYCEIADDYPWKVDFPRNILETIIDCDGTPLRVFSLHLSHLPGPHRQIQTNTIRELLASVPTESKLRAKDFPLLGLTTLKNDIPVPEDSLLLGDFNFCLDDEDYKYLTEPQTDRGTQLFDAWPLAKSQTDDRSTCVEDDEWMTIDFLFVTKNLIPTINSAYTDHSIIGSDHFPIYFEIDV